MLAALWIAALLQAVSPQSPDATVAAGDEPGAGGGSPPISISSLLAELTDPRAPSEFPARPFQTRLASGRTPAAVDPDVAGRFGEHLGERALLACAGPGALVRLWCARPSGTLRVYVDGRREAVLTAALAELMQGRGGVPAPLAESSGETGTLLLPIPFAESCLVTCAGSESLACELDYLVWEPGTPVTSFAAGDLERHAQRLAAAARSLERPAAPGEGEITHPFGHLIGSTGKNGAAVYAGLSNDAGGQPSAVTELRLRVRDGDPQDGADLPQLLREALLILTFDGVDTARVPLADCFGLAAGLAPFESRFLSVQVGEQAALLTARFPMPFRESLFVRVESLCPEPLDVLGYVTLAPYEWTPRTLYFHATWRGERDVPAQPARDWTAARLAGRGQLVGEALSWTTPVEAHWRAGGVKIRVDAEPFPSILGHGAADGVDGDGSSAALLSGRARSGAAGASVTWSEWRLRILDAVPFFARLDLDRELLPPSGAPDLRLDLAATAWFYADLAEGRTGDSRGALESLPAREE